MGGGTPDTTNPEYWNGDIDWYSPTEIGTKVYANGSVKKITALGLEKSSAKILPANSTILFTSRAGIGDMAILKKQGATNQGFQSFVVGNGVNVYFLYSMGRQIKDFAIKNASGSTFLEISKNQLAKMNVIIPNEKEQTAIGNFFKQLDAAIASHQRKLERVKELKKSLLQKMFPKDGEAFPELRFPNFTDAWEQRKLGELYKKNTERNELKFPIEKTISIAKMVFNPEGNGALSESLVNYRVLRVGDIAFEGHKNKDFLFGRFVLNDVGNGIMSPRFSSLRPIEYLNISFWKQYIHYEPIMRGILKNSTKLGTMMNELVIDDFLKQPIDVPTLKEQTAIGDFFRQLDAAIASHQRKPVLQKASKIKQADTISACFWLAKSSQMPHHNIGILIFKFLNNMNISVLRGGHARMPEPSRHAGNRYPGKKQ